MLQTLERTVLSAEPTCETRLLGAGDAPALRAFCGAALPLLPAPGLGPALHGGRLLGDFAADALQAAAALLPLFADDPLPAALRAAGFGADGQGAVLTPPLTAARYTRLRQFLHAALRLATARCASYHVWAVQLLDGDPAACADLCAQYLAAGLTLRAVLPYSGAQLLVFSARGLAHWRAPRRCCRLGDPALPRLLERGCAAADFQWDAGGLALVLRDDD
ncbi:MAG TPA: hypothetical protein H9846_00690 [Candidatus Gemmiger excrementipullorum]|uniref:Uncharacterized protein n=1 Tax=Candidatus Gemmiger excrementipullorum TaxID=2838610 RepID=A0A9D2BUF5_9FIRM|nr:hypothetical protein [Candidatus Gemmiger excrementipullorum]